MSNFAQLIFTRIPFLFFACFILRAWLSMIWIFGFFQKKNPRTHCGKLEQFFHAHTYEKPISALFFLSLDEIKSFWHAPQPWFPCKNVLFDMGILRIFCFTLKTILKYRLQWRSETKVWRSRLYPIKLSFGYFLFDLYYRYQPQTWYEYIGN